jgi:hypothetical protein
VASKDDVKKAHKEANIIANGVRKAKKRIREIDQLEKKGYFKKHPKAAEKLREERQAYKDTLPHALEGAKKARARADSTSNAYKDKLE